jgi:hypothetical protein
MRKLLILPALALVAGLFAVMAVPALAGSGKGPPIDVGPVAIVGADDIGTCNNVWAQDSFDKFYTLKANLDGTYNLQVNYKNGTFVTNAGQSPGACESGTYNGSTVAAGVTGRTHQEYNATVTATGTPNRTPNCAANNGCTRSGDFLNAVFGTGNWSKTAFGWTGHYEAGSHGVWFDTDVNWPLNDRGDITSP